MSARPVPPGARLSLRLAAGICAACLLSAIGLHAFLAGEDGGDGRGDQAIQSPAQEQEPGKGTPPVDDSAGPTSTAHGVPAGFARTEDGAIAAASAYVCTGQALLDMDPLAAEKAVRQISASATADEQVERILGQLAQARQTLASGTGPITYRQGVIARRVDAYSQDQARVALWHVGVLSRQGAAPPQAGWATSTIELVWERGDWKVAREDVVPGPAPILDDSTAPATSELFAAALDGFTDAGVRW